MTTDRQFLGTARSVSHRETRQYQEEMADLLRRLFTLPSQVSVDWRAMAHEVPFFAAPRAQKGHLPRMYEPAIDIAVGPFAIEQRLVMEYDDLMLSSRGFIDRLISCHAHNTQALVGAHLGSMHFDVLRERNANARCFLAVEIERGNRDPKYLMGSAVNACSLGRIGVIVVWDEAKLQQFLRIERYLKFLAALEKNIFSSMNLVIVDRRQFQEAITATIDGLPYSVGESTAHVS